MLLLLLLDVVAHLDRVPCPFRAFAFMGCSLGNLYVIVKQSVIIIITTATNNNATTVASACHAVAFIAIRNVRQTQQVSLTTPTPAENWRVTIYVQHLKPGLIAGVGVKVHFEGEVAQRLRPPSWAQTIRVSERRQRGRTKF